MHHHVVHTRPGRLLFSNAAEASKLWHTLRHAIPSTTALCLMPDHLHLLHEDRVSTTLGAVLSGYTRWKNRRQGRRGPLLRPSPVPQPVVGAQKRRRSIRYVHLNPCRARLVCDPLEWPFSTHLDAVGLSIDPAIRPVADPLRFHAWVSGDPTVSVGGTSLPCPSPAASPGWRVLAAVSVATRTSADAITARRGPARSLLIRTLRGLTDLSPSEVAAHAGVSESTVFRAPPATRRELDVIGRLAADERFDTLDDRWSPHRTRR